MKKQDQLSASSAFGAAATARSARRQKINEAVGETPFDPTRVPVEKLVGNPENPRESLGDLQELAESLITHGLRQPLGVMPSTDFARVYPQHKEAVGKADLVVINGNRRLAAAKEAKLSTLAVYVTTLSDDTAVQIAALVENIHRQDLSPLDEAKAVQQLVKIYGSQAETARRLATNRQWVGQRLALLGLIPELQEALRSGDLKIKEARRLGTLAPEEQPVAWERIVNPVDTDPGESEATPSPEGPSHDVNPVDTPPNESVNAPAPGGSPRGVNPVDTDPGESEATPSPEGPSHDVNPVDTPPNESVNAPAPGGSPRGVNPVDTDEKKQPGEDASEKSSTHAVPEKHRVEGIETSVSSGEQLTLDLQWEPRTMAQRLREELGEEKFGQLVEAGLELTG